MRTCIGCRQRRRDIELLRVVALDGTVVPDIRRSLPGRGAWVHATVECVAAARKRRAFARALRSRSELDAMPVVRFVTEAAVPACGTLGATGTGVRKQGNEVDPS